MAILSASDLAVARNYFVSEINNIDEPIGVIKSELAAAVAAADAWADSNAASFNSALPVAARNNLTTKQKARLLSAVIRRRYEIS